jgi:GntR family transcriptional repressor for pyruvate dehydrogenase complex
LNLLNENEKRPSGVNPVRRKSLVSLILDQLREFIASAGLRAGDRLPPERQLAEQLAVSRPSLRIALDWLSERGALRRVQGGGTYLEPNIAMVLAQSRDNEFVDKAHLRDVVEARFLIEPHLAELAASRGTPEQIQKLRQGVEEARGGDPFAWYQHELVFHVGLARLAGNAFLAGALETMFPQILATWQARTEPFDVAGAAADHLRILDAIAQKDGTLASREMTNHLERFRHTIIA